MTTRHLIAALSLPLVAAIVLIILQIHTNDRVDTALQAQQDTAYKNALNNHEGCVRGVASRERLIDIFKSLREARVEPALLSWVQNATQGISEYPASQNPHRVNLVNCDLHYPVPSEPPGFDDRHP